MMGFHHRGGGEKNDEGNGAAGHRVKTGAFPSVGFDQEIIAFARGDYGVERRRSAEMGKTQPTPVREGGWTGGAPSWDFYEAHR